MLNNRVHQSSQNNREITRLIPPPSESIEAVLYNLYKLGLHENQQVTLSRDLLSVIIALSNEMLHVSLENRKEILMRLLPMSEEKGDSDKIYEVIDTYPRKIVSGDKVTFYQTAFIDGQFVNPTHLDPYYIDKASCEVCGAEVHCWKEYVGIGGEITKMCNHCLYSSEDHKAKNMSSGLNGCRSCTVQRCPRHPFNIR